MRRWIGFGTLVGFMVKIQRANIQSSKFSVDWGTRSRENRSLQLQGKMSCAYEQLGHLLVCIMKAQCKHENQSRVQLLTLDRRPYSPRSVYSMINSARGSRDRRRTPPDFREACNWI